ncbi:MAG TPA: GNAT family protein [Mycobacteriales bacterium]|jgi:aminoglycoside 6'-N-acetyltransferase
MIADVPLATERLVLRRFRPDDAAAFAAYRSHPDVARYQSWTPPVPLAAATELAQTFAAGNPRRPGWFQYAIELAADQRLIGDVGVCLHDNAMQAELGFTVAPDEQGHGYATEAVGRIIDHLVGERGLRRLAAECDARNVASAALLRRLGFTLEGRRRAHTWIKGEWTDDLVFGLLAEEWPPDPSRPLTSGPPPGTPGR